MLEEVTMVQEKVLSRTERLLNVHINWKKSFFAFSIFSAAQFIILTFIATHYYKGGSWNDATNPGYSFIWNYISDLGRIYSIAGELNTISRIIFTVSVTIVGTGEIMFSFAFAYFYYKEKLTTLRILPLISGVLYGLGYIVIGSLPLDKYNNPHVMMVVVACCLKVLTISLYIFVINKDMNCPVFYCILCGAYIAIFTVFILFLLLARIGVLFPFEATCIVGQRITFYLEAIFYIIFSSGMIKLTTKKTNDLLKVKNGRPGGI